jgi:hypothetical protein
MVQVIVVIREIGREKPDYSLPFDLPGVPSAGDYISIFRPDSPTHSEDVIVRHVWWHLHSPETRAVVTGGEPKIGRLREVMVECDVAVGPYARDQWRDSAEAAKRRGVDVAEFNVARVSVRESDLRR